MLNIYCNFLYFQEAMKAFTYLIFVAILVASVIFIVIFVPETKNKTFDEVAAAIGFGRPAKSGPFAGDANNQDEEMQPMGGGVKA